MVTFPELPDEWAVPRVSNGRQVLLLEDEHPDEYKLVIESFFPGSQVQICTDPQKALRQIRVMAERHPGKCTLVCDNRLGDDENIMKGSQVIRQMESDKLKAEAILFSSDHPLLETMQKEGRRTAYKSGWGLEPLVIALLHSFASQYASESRHPLPPQIAAAEGERKEAERQRLEKDLTLIRDFTSRHAAQPFVNRKLDVPGGFASYEADDGRYLRLLRERDRDRDRLLTPDGKSP